MRRRPPSPIKHRTMSQYAVETSKVPSPGRPRHQITRSISEISSPIRLHRHHSHRVIRERERDALSPITQSATSLQRPSPQPYEVSSKSAGGTPNISPNPSRRPSLLYASADDEGMPASHGPTLVSTSAPASITKSSAEVDLVKEQQKAAVRNRLVFLFVFCHPLSHTYANRCSTLSQWTPTIT